MAAPLTDEERRELQIERDFQAKRQAGPFWSGSREEWEEVDAKKGGNFNPFEDAETYGKKRRKKPFQLANFKKVKVCCKFLIVFCWAGFLSNTWTSDPEFMPKEIRDIVTDEGGEDDSAEQSKKKKRLGLTKKFAVDNLAKLDEGIDGTNAEPGHDAEEDVDSEKEDEEDGFEREAEDDAFEEDEDDADDDYNAEKYYDGGDDDLDDGDDYGEDGY